MAAGGPARPGGRQRARLDRAGSPRGGQAGMQVTDKLLTLARRELSHSVEIIQHSELSKPMHEDLDPRDGDAFLNRGRCPAARI